MGAGCPPPEGELKRFNNEGSDLGYESRLRMLALRRIWGNPKL